MKNPQCPDLKTLLSIGAIVLSGCGGGGSESSDRDGGVSGGTLPSANKVGGVAAVGTPIVGGNINIICASGTPLTAFTSGGGEWSVTLAGQTFPCAVEVTGGTINGAANSASYRSIALTSGTTVNVTPLTELLVASLVGTAPVTWFSGLNTSPSSLATISQYQVDTAYANLITLLSGLPPLSVLNPISTVFTAVPGNVNDDMLTGLAVATSTANISYDYLLDNLATSSAEISGLRAALTAAYSGTSSGRTAYVSQGGLTWMPPFRVDNVRLANAYCDNEKINGTTGWRLPTINELNSFSDSGAWDVSGWTIGVTWSATVTGEYYYVQYLGSPDKGYYTVPQTGPATGILGNFVTCVR